ncbi:MAG TPA: permease [Candidatus Limiplasma sp.]|nr:permease [Candidatus Limiplasma sp.]
MQSLSSNRKISKVIGFLLLTASIFWIGFRFGMQTSSVGLLDGIRGFTLILLSILLEALPFVLLGIIVSSVIQVFITEEMILKIMPRNHFLRLMFASLVGLIFPVCECAIIPITRGLIKKGMPIGPAIAFMLATPIVNPIVLLSTYNAFPTMPLMMPLRAACGLIGAVAGGALVGRAKSNDVLKESITTVCSCGEHCHNENSSGCQSKRKRDLFLDVLHHTSTELQGVGAYLIFGAIIAAGVQSFVPAKFLTGIGSGEITSILVMMGLAYLLSLCSEADAFVANTFLYQFSGASVLAFLIVGPMIDIKNTFMMLGSFKKRFTARLIITILVVCFALALASSLLIGGFYG